MTEKKHSSALSESFIRMLPRLFRGVSVFVFACMIIAMVIYGVSVVYECKVIKQGRETRALREENLDLQIKLDRYRSYQKIADDSAKIHGLKIATEVIQVPQMPQNPEKIIPTTAPVSPVPNGGLGY